MASKIIVRSSAKPWRVAESNCKWLRVPWNEKGWAAGTSHSSGVKAPIGVEDWVLLQYTALGWSVRGFPLLDFVVTGFLGGGRRAVPLSSMTHPSLRAQGCGIACETLFRTGQCGNCSNIRSVQSLRYHPKH